MRRYRPALIALVLLGLALPSASDALRRKRSGVSSTTVISLPLTSSGARFSDDAGTKSHVVFDGVSITDLYGNSWSMVGTVPQVADTVMPTTQDTGAAGPYSASNYYTLGTGADVLDTDQQVHGCIAFYMSSTMTYGVLYDNSLNATRGRILRLDLGPVLAFITFDPLNRGVSAAVTEGTAGIPALNVACWWHTASEVGINVNGTESISLGAWTEVPGTSDQARLGIESAGTTYPFVEGGIIEFTESTGVACPGASCSAWAADQVRRKFGAAGFTFARATPATYENDGRMWRVPSGIPRITSRGMLSEQLTINQILQSEQTNAANGWTLSGDVVTLDQGPAGWTDLDAHAFGSATPTAYRAAAASITAGQTLTGSAWYYSPPATGNPTARLAVSQASGTIGTCTCGRSDGGSCTPGTITATCFADFVMVDGAAPARFWVSAVTTATGLPYLYLKMGLGGSINVTYLIGRAQIEFGPGTTVTSYISTAGTTAQRNADQATAPWPSGVAYAGPWCMAATQTPYGTARSTGYTGIFATDIVSTHGVSASYNGIMTRLDTIIYAGGATSALVGADTTGSDTFGLCYWYSAGATAYYNGVGGTPVFPGQITQTLSEFRFGRAASDAYFANGYMSNVRMCRSNVMSRCR